MNRWRAYLFDPVTRPRLFLVARCTLLLLAFDVWSTHWERAGRYGVGDFNVAHFAWLDALQPAPSSGWYIGVLVVASLAAFVAALSGTSRWLVAIVAVTYSYGWMMSLIDSYQHHYFLSLVVICLLGFGNVRVSELAASELAGEGPPRAVAWGYPLLCVTVAITYIFASVSKMDEAWRSGVVLQTIFGKRMEPLLEIWTSIGLPEAWFWPLNGYGVVIVQLLIAAAYVAAPFADRCDGKALRALCLVGLLAAIVFHLGAEWAQFKIGWFSYYMILLAVGCLVPGGWLSAVGRAIARSTTALMKRVKAASEAPMQSAFVSIIAALTMLFFAAGVDLPSVLGVVAFIAASCLASVVAASRGLSSWRNARARTLAVALGIASMWVAVDFSDTRYNYYRYVGGDGYRRAIRQDDHEAKRALLTESLRAYEKANRWAPADDDRRDKEEKVRQLLETM